MDLNEIQYEREPPNARSHKNCKNLQTIGDRSGITSVCFLGGISFCADNKRGGGVNYVGKHAYVILEHSLVPYLIALARPVKYIYVYDVRTHRSCL